MLAGVPQVVEHPVLWNSTQPSPRNLLDPLGKSTVKAIANFRKNESPDSVGYEECGASKSVARGSRSVRSRASARGLWRLVSSDTCLPCACVDAASADDYLSPAWPPCPRSLFRSGKEGLCAGPVWVLGCAAAITRRATSKRTPRITRAIPHQIMALSASTAELVAGRLIPLSRPMACVRSVTSWSCLSWFPPTPHRMPPRTTATAPSTMSARPAGLLIGARSGTPLLTVCASSSKIIPGSCAMPRMVACCLLPWNTPGRAVLRYSRPTRHRRNERTVNLRRITPNCRKIWPLSQQAATRERHMRRRSQRLSQVRGWPRPPPIECGP